MSENRKRKYEKVKEFRRLLEINKRSNVISNVSHSYESSELLKSPLDDGIITEASSNKELESPVIESPDLIDFNNDYEIDDEVLFQLSDDDTSKNSSNSDISLLLYFWCLQFNITNNALSALLVILNKHFPELPKDSRTFKKTPRKTCVEEMGQGSYYHFGFVDVISSFLKRNVKNVVGNLLSIDVGIDGLPLFKSSSSQFWPILGNIVGFSDVFLIGNYHGNTKPVDSEIFLKKFIEDALDKIKNGILFNGVKYFIKFRAFVCDAPARSFVLKIKGHTGYYACTKCTTKGSYILNRVTFPELNASLRTNETFLKRENLEHHHSTCQSGLEKMNIGCVTQFPLDYMHCMLLGVMKQLLTLWIKVKKRPFSLSETLVENISNKMKLLSPQITFEFKRKPRSLNNFEKFKATEFRLFLLYIGPIVLKGDLPSVYYNHFLKFHCAVRILSDPDDCKKNNKLGKQLLTDFVKQFSELYGDHTITFNVHNLIHVADDVLEMGHLDNYSAFKFENHMQVLKKRVRKGFEPLKQIVNRIKEENTICEIYDYKKENNYPIYKKQLKDNSFMSVELKEYKFSIHPPNNFCLFENKIIKITKIYCCENLVKFTGEPIRHLHSFFKYPISSSNLNIFTADNLQYEEAITFSNNSLKKVLHLKLNNISVFIPNIHTE